MLKIRKGDQVIVTTGKDKGKRGTVLSVRDRKAVVEGINVAKKHQKPVPQLGKSGGIVEKEMAIDISNIALLNTQTDKADKVGFRVLEDGKKVRFYKSTNEVVDV